MHLIKLTDQNLHHGVRKRSSSISLDSTTFTCSFPDHCQQNQMLEILVDPSSSTAALLHLSFPWLARLQHRNLESSSSRSNEANSPSESKLASSLSESKQAWHRNRFQPAIVTTILIMTLTFYWT
ncbi:hypothetical protein ACFE04_000660 [Oxalis oulophora]